MQTNPGNKQRDKIEHRVFCIGISSGVSLSRCHVALKVRRLPATSCQFQRVVMDANARAFRSTSFDRDRIRIIGRIDRLWQHYARMLTRRARFLVHIACRYFTRHTCFCHFGARGDRWVFHFNYRVDAAGSSTELLSFSIDQLPAACIDSESREDDEPNRPVENSHAQEVPRL